MQTTKPTPPVHSHSSPSHPAQTLRESHNRARETIATNPPAIHPPSANEIPPAATAPTSRQRPREQTPSPPSAAPLHSATEPPPTAIAIAPARPARRHPQHSSAQTATSHP